MLDATKRLWLKYPSFSRKIHRLISPFVAAQLIVSVTTGFLHTFYSKILVQPAPDILMAIHQGKFGSAEWTRIPLTLIFSLIIFLGIITGIPLMQKIWTRDFWRVNSLRSLHSFSSTFMFIFYIINAATGLIYRQLREIFDINKDYVKWLITIHAGSFNRWTEIIYISLITFLTILFVLSGVVCLIVWIVNKIMTKIKKKVEVVDEEYANIMDESLGERFEADPAHMINIEMKDEILDDEEEFRRTQEIMGEQVIKEIHM